jgi:hypothetical protein
MKESEFQDLVEALDLGELELLKESIEARLWFLSQVPERELRQLFDRNIRNTVAEVDGLYAGRVVYCDEHAALLQDAPGSVTIHRFDEPMIPTPRGEYLELRRIKGRYEVSRDRGRRWRWLELDRAEALDVLSRIGLTAELAVRRPGPEHLRLMVPQTHDATYRGTILGVTAHHVLQRVGRSEVIAHCMKDFAQAPREKSDLSVRYHFGRVKSVKLRERDLGREGRDE